MFVERIELEEILKEKSLNILFDKEKSEKIVDNIFEKHAFPSGKATEIITQKIPFDKLSDEVLYFLSEEFLKDSIEQYFTPKEIRMYKDLRYEDATTIKFPYELKMIQVAEDQWIGSVNAGFFIGLGCCGKINYNPKTQRVMKKYKKRNESTDYWKPTVSQKSVNEIVQEFKTRNFISNTITLNITEDSELEYEYDNQTNVFVIHSLDHFDITDGYHRYLAMQKMFSYDDEFNFPMEIRITRFDESKAQHWIYQEDQKTKMRKVDSNSLNQNSVYNQIVESLNSFGSVLQGKISRNEGIISYSVLADCIKNYYYGNTIPKSVKENKSYKNELIKELKAKFRLLSDLNDSFLDKRIEEYILYLIMFEFFSEKDIEVLEKKLVYIMDNIGEFKKVKAEIKSNSYKSFVEKAVCLLEEDL